MDGDPQFRCFGGCGPGIPSGIIIKEVTCHFLYPEVGSRRWPPSTPPRDSRAAARPSAAATTRRRLLDATIERLVEEPATRAPPPPRCVGARASRRARSSSTSRPRRSWSPPPPSISSPSWSPTTAPAFAAVAGEGDRVAAAVRSSGRDRSASRASRPPSSSTSPRAPIAELAASLRPVADRHAENLRRQARAALPRGRAGERRTSTPSSTSRSRRCRAPRSAARRCATTARDERLLAILTRLVRDTFTPR